MNDEDENGLLIAVAGVICGLLLVGLFGAFGPVLADMLR